MPKKKTAAKKSPVKVKKKDGFRIKAIAEKLGDFLSEDELELVLGLTDDEAIVVNKIIEQVLWHRGAR